MTRDLKNDYFKWLCELVSKGKYHEPIYNKLLLYLHSVEFTYSISRDGNRAADGIDLRYRYAYNHRLDEIPACLDGPCSVLEMMVALAIRCEETIMDDPHIGNRTSQWFWQMIVNLGLGPMVDDKFDKDHVEDVISKFLNRKYDSDGKGGLFTVRNHRRDLRRVEIWHQLCWYLDSIT